MSAGPVGAISCGRVFNHIRVQVGWQRMKQGNVCAHSQSMSRKMSRTQRIEPMLRHWIKYQGQDQRRMIIHRTRYALV